MPPPKSALFHLSTTSLNLYLCRIPKKWKWTGKLLLDVADRTDHVCDVVLNDLVPMLTEGLRFNNTMAPMDSIHLLSFHDLADMSDFLKTCVHRLSPGPSQQLARLGPNSDKDAEPLKILARYMAKRRFVRFLFAVRSSPSNGMVNRSALFQYPRKATFWDISCCSPPPGRFL
jgi:hypothetical protein